jgi:uncharacterized damage-inducible protein DinB
MKRYPLTLSVVVSVLLAAPVLAQTAGDPLSQANKAFYERVKTYITKAADQMSEADYAFKPTPEVRSFGQLVAHVADANYMICGAAAAEKPPAAEVEKTKTTKPDIQKGLADSFAYCDKIYGGMTDAQAATPVSFFGNSMPKLAVLSFNTSHDFEHYGNIVTYMRLKGLVPPSSQRPKP